MQWPSISIGTRPSRLAGIQVDMVRAALCGQVPDLAGRISVHDFSTPGDRDRKTCLEALGGRGVFTDTLDVKVVTGEIDCVVHAMKDMGPDLHPDLVIGAVLERADPREVLVAPSYGSLADLPKGAIVGSSSIRRQAFVRRLRPDIQFRLLRGNVEERIEQMQGADYDATVLAYAGLQRLGLLGHVTQVFELQDLPPDPAQGAIGIVCHKDNFVVRRVLQWIDHAPTHAAVNAERALLRSLPRPDALAIGAIAHAQGSCLTLSATLLSAGGAEAWTQDDQGTVDNAAELGCRVGAALYSHAERLLSA